MKPKCSIWPNLFLIIGIVVVLTISCKKDEEEITDADGNIYTSVTIGSQVWMVENLVTTRLNDGTEIPYVTDNNEWINLVSPGYCLYDDNLSNKSTYGVLYNWYTVNTGKLCPAGWHIPADTEWVTLSNYLGGNDIAGGKLKEAGTAHWISPNTGATNESGFTALPGGNCSYDGSFYNTIYKYGTWWSTSEHSTIGAWNFTLFYDRSSVLIEADLKIYGFSVRCLKDR